MNENEVKLAAREWSGFLSGEGIPHVIIGSAAMLLCKCDSGREAFKDIDFLVPEDRVQEVKDTLLKKGFTVGQNKNYEKDGVTVGIATPKTHNGLPCPTDDSIGTMIDGACVMKLDDLIETKRLAVVGQMHRIGKEAGYRRHRQKSVAKQLCDFCALCHARDKQNNNSE